jgi:dipeptidase
MCDTMVAVGPATADGSVLFAKNSDREPGEAQALELVAAQDHEAGARVRCTYIEIPQASRTHAVLLSRPHWMWGAEMGANERGLVIGNEAVFTRTPQQGVGLLGMDMLRLALERAGTAQQGVEVLGALLEEHGQGGPAGYRDTSMRYDNSFILADPEDAWVLETAGRAWVAARVSGIRSISNGLTIRDRWDRGSAHLEAYARDQGLLRGRGAFDFASTFADPLMTRGAAAARRRRCSQSYLRRRAGRLEARDAMSALRQHGPHDRPELARRGVLMTVCAHASWWPTRRAGQTTASLVSHLGRSGTTHFVTGTAAPCTSVFKPVWLDAGLPDLGPTPGDRFDPATLWWRHELLHRGALADLPAFLAAFSPVRDQLEDALSDAALELAGASADERLAHSVQAFDEAEQLESAWRDGYEPTGPERSAYARFWSSVDGASGLDCAPPLA